MSEAHRGINYDLAKAESDKVDEEIIAALQNGNSFRVEAGAGSGKTYVLHTVGPIVQRRVSRKDRSDLAACYHSCLQLAAAHNLQSVAFCCISTGEFHFPNQEAAEIAVRTVKEFLNQQTSSIEKVIFNVFKNTDLKIYRHLLETD